MPSLNITSECFELDLRTLKPGTRFFDAESRSHYADERTTETFMDINGNQWYLNDKPVRVWTIREYEVRGSAADFITLADDAPAELVEGVQKWADCDFYVRDVETGEDVEMYCKRDACSLELEPLQKAVEEANKDVS